MTSRNIGLSSDMLDATLRSSVVAEGLKEREHYTPDRALACAAVIRFVFNLPGRPLAAQLDARDLQADEVF
jgi:hypothetical protein